MLRQKVLVLIDRLPAGEYKGGQRLPLTPSSHLLTFNQKIEPRPFSYRQKQNAIDLPLIGSMRMIAAALPEVLIA
jgi:hypothetical protein